MENTSERLRNAVAVLAEGAEPLGERLKVALETLAPLRPDDFSIPELKKEFEDIDSVAHQRGSIAASVKAMSEEDMRLTASNILGLFEQAVIVESGGNI